MVPTSKTSRADDGVWFVLAAVLVFILMSSDARDSFYMWLAVIAILIVLPFMVLVNLFLQARTQARKLAEATERSTYTFRDTGVLVVTATSSTHFLWERVQKITETTDDFIVFPQQNIFYPLPERFFDDSQIPVLRHLIAEGIGERATLLI